MPELAVAGPSAMGTACGDIRSSTSPDDYSTASSHRNLRYDNISATGAGPSSGRRRHLYPVASGDAGNRSHRDLKGDTRWGVSKER